MQHMRPMARALCRASLKSAKYHLFAFVVRDGYVCVFSDIVKRRSFRATIATWFFFGRAMARVRLHYLQIAVPLDCKIDQMRLSLLVKLDRLIIGSILRSKLVFLINDPAAIECIPRLRGFWVRVLSFVTRGNCSQHSAECVDIDNESNQVP